MTGGVSALAAIRREAGRLSDLSAHVTDQVPDAVVSAVLAACTDLHYAASLLDSALKDLDQ